MPAEELRYKRLLVKLSGEALVGKGAYGIDMHIVDRLAQDISEAVEAGCQMSVVVGGGNIFRGLQGAAKGMDRATADYMGMLATVMNALAFQNALEHLKTPARGCRRSRCPRSASPTSAPRRCTTCARAAS